MELANPFEVKDDIAFLRGLLHIYVGLRTGLPDAVFVDRPRVELLDRNDARIRAELSFLHALLPRDLASQLHEKTRLTSLWARTPELWCEATSHTDLTPSLSMVARQRFFEIWAMFREAERRIALTGKGQAEPPSAVARSWFAAAALRIEPWVHVLALHMWSQLGPNPNAVPLLPRSSLTRQTESAIAAAVREAAEKPESKEAFAKLVALAVPGVCLIDVREMLWPRGLGRREWLDAVDVLADGNGLWQHLSVFPDEDDLEISGEPVTVAPGSPPPATVLAAPGTRLLWSPDVIAQVNRELWRAWQAGSTGDAIRAQMRRVRRGLANRHWGTHNPHYRQLSLLIRFFESEGGAIGAGGPRPDRNSMAAALERLEREVIALRRQELPGHEAELHRWMIWAPECEPAALLERLHRILYHRFTFGCVGIHAGIAWLTFCQAEKGAAKGDEVSELLLGCVSAARKLLVPDGGRLQTDYAHLINKNPELEFKRDRVLCAAHLVDGLLDSKYGRNIHAGLRPVIPWPSDHLSGMIAEIATRPVHPEKDRRTQLASIADEVIHRRRSELRRERLEQQNGPAVQSSPAETDEPARRRRQALQHGRLELVLLAEVHRWIEDQTSDWDPSSPELELGVVVCERVLNQIIKSSERSRLDYTRLVARLTWALELRLLLAEAPDYARLSPASEVIREHVGAEGLALLNAVVEMVVLRAAAWRELVAANEKPLANRAWARVSEIVCESPKAR